METSAFLHVQKKAIMSQSFASLSFNRQQVNCENSVATTKHSTYEHVATTIHVYIRVRIILPLQYMSSFDWRPCCHYNACLHSTDDRVATTVHVYIQLPIMLPLQCMSTFDRRPPLAAHCRPGSKEKYWRLSEKKQYFLTPWMFISRWN